VGYGATECVVAKAYGRNDHNLYRLEANGYIEFLDVEKEGVPANLFQPVRNLLKFFDPSHSNLKLSQVAS